MTAARQCRALAIVIMALGLGLSALMIPAAMAAPSASSAPRPSTAGPSTDSCAPGQLRRTPPKDRLAMLRDHAPVAASRVMPVKTPELAELVRALPARVQIPVRVHVIRGKHRGESGPARPKVRAMIRTLNAGFAGAQSSDSAPTRFRFVLKSINYTKNDSWYHAYNFNRADVRAKNRLHRGGKRTLNVFINGGGERAQPVLGWSRLPWQRARSPKLDGVSVNVAALPGGRAANYNLGDTIIHETGHWLGLLHPWQGGCSEPNDGVGDTPQTAGPSYYCDEDSDTCRAPGLDPIHNFMNYSYDVCLNQFTPGQVARMDRMWAGWRS